MGSAWKPQMPWDNEMDKPVSYAPGTPERKALLEAIEALKRRTEEIPLVIAGETIQTDEIHEVRCPHDHRRVVARAHQATDGELQRAADAALNAWEEWSRLDGYQRAAVFYRAADLLAGPYRVEVIAAIMLNQSKTPYEAEIDLGELVDFWRHNAYYMQWLYEQQPKQVPGEFNRVDWRPLEGFVLAVPPFNFFAIGGNLPTAPAMVGNVVLWKPSRSVLLSNYRIMQVLQEAGLPPGVINFVPFSSRYGDGVIEHPEFAGLHFTGSYETLIHLWRKVGENLSRYRNFPRIVGETGGKDFIIVHPSFEEVEPLVANVIRAAYGYQGQKCSAASRLYAPRSLWGAIKERLLEELPRIKVGPTEDLETFMGAVIDEAAFEKIASYIDHAREHSDEYEIVYGGEYDDSQGWFVQPTVIEATNPRGKLMREEIFGPVLTVYVYPDDAYEQVLELCDDSDFALTGAIFARDRHAVVRAEEALRYTAGNFYINDKPTGSIPGRQPFGGARHSGTNDKAGFWTNLVRWMSPRAIKETRVPAREWGFPYMG